MDEADDYDDFIFALPPDNDDDYDDDCHNYEVYAEVYYEGNDTLYTSDARDGDCELILPDVPEGNYTFEMYYEEFMEIFSRLDGCILMVVIQII